MKPSRVDLFVNFKFGSLVIHYPKKEIVLNI